MIEDLANSSPEHGKAKLPRQNAPVLAVVKFIEENLPEYINEHLQNPVDISNENGLTQNLVNHLRYLDWNYPFYFDKENMEDESKGNSPTVDLAVYTRKKIIVKTRAYSPKGRFFAVEAKRLGLSGKREKEYLVGHWEGEEQEKYIESGGIERFKKHIHGKRLLHSGMIGYVQKNDFSYWLTKINGWVDEFIQNPQQSLVSWEEGDKLSPEITDHQRIAKHTSLHSRREDSTELDSITLYHLWVDLKPTDK